jgi:hypothetical protein
MKKNKPDDFRNADGDLGPNWKQIPVKPKRKKK